MKGKPKKESEVERLDFSEENENLFARLMGVGKKDPIFMQNLAECIGIVSILESLELEEHIISDKVTVIRDGIEVLEDRPRYVVEERNKINQDGTPVITENGYPEKEWVAIAQTETIIANIKLKKGVSVEHATKILVPMLNSKAKTAVINGQANVHLQLLRNAASYSKITSNTTIKHV